ncbi:hypothetical protein CLOSTMETH_01942 [[Clostridium] methylpentosum DSM 5476]|uniref:Uncharacterized protein n=1 Tax=[Clostridium] methylpentosum DSM 5476 TaxID=537013 RepID=C0EDL4_9FIRM|nr:hypothetical protein CLOSTMETH_01942 [[Clostridium] methylpentosum DSM 5476]
MENNRHPSIPHERIGLAVMVRPHRVAEFSETGTVQSERGVQ